MIRSAVFKLSSISIDVSEEEYISDGVVKCLVRETKSLESR